MVAGGVRPEQSGQDQFLCSPFSPVLEHSLPVLRRRLTA
jgi:hypothetical protein